MDNWLYDDDPGYPVASTSYGSACNYLSPLSPTHQPPEPQALEQPQPTFNYYVKIINIKRKSDFVVRMWHDVKSVFQSLEDMKVELMKSFPTEVPSTSSFQVGYLEPPNNAKRWLIEERDLNAMYKFFEPGAKITIWCDARTTLIKKMSLH